MAFRDEEQKGNRGFDREEEKMGAWGSLKGEIGENLSRCKKQVNTGTKVRLPFE
jgi:hypothetical protein